MDKVISEIIQRVPNLLWPIIIVLSLYGLIVFITKIYDLRIKVKKDYKQELIEHLDFRGKRLEEYKNYASELCNQLDMQKQIADVNYQLAIDVLNEKNKTKQEYGYALMTCMWMYEREKFTRKILATLLSKGKFPEDISIFLGEHTHSIISLLDSNDNLYLEIGKQNSGTLEDKIVSALSKVYLLIPIDNEISVFSELTKKILELPTIKLDQEGLENRTDVKAANSIES